MKNKLVITNILVGSYLAKLDILRPGDIISRINDKSIKSLADFRKYFFNSTCHRQCTCKYLDYFNVSGN